MASDSKLPVAAIVGVGPGLGAALSSRFAREYRVALIARGQDYLTILAKEIASAGGHALPVAADVASAGEITRAFETIRGELADPEVLIYNASASAFGGLMEIKPDSFENAWRVSAFGAFLCSREVVPAMLARGKGVILFTGATAGTKAAARSAAFGPAKFAMRGLSQAMARDLQPQGIHVAYINVDGMIDTPRVRERFPQLEDEKVLKPSAIAESYWFLAHQERSAWTSEIDVRPFLEKF